MVRSSYEETQGGPSFTNSDSLVPFCHQIFKHLISVWTDSKCIMTPISSMHDVSPNKKSSFCKLYKNLQNVVDDHIFHSRHDSTDPEEEIEQRDEDGGEDKSETSEDEKKKLFHNNVKLFSSDMCQLMIDDP